MHYFVATEKLTGCSPLLNLLHPLLHLHLSCLQCCQKVLEFLAHSNCPLLRLQICICIIFWTRPSLSVYLSNKVGFSIWGVLAAVRSVGDNKNKETLVSKFIQCKSFSGKCTNQMTACNTNNHLTHKILNHKNQPLKWSWWLRGVI